MKWACFQETASARTPAEGTVADWMLSDLHVTREESVKLILPYLMAAGLPAHFALHRGHPKEGHTVAGIASLAAEKLQMSIVLIENPGNTNENYSILLANKFVAMRAVHGSPPLSPHESVLFSFCGEAGRVKDLHELVAGMTEPPKAREKRGTGRFFMLTSHRGAFRFRRIGTAGAELEPVNYPTPVVEAFDPLVSWLREPSPHGRLVLFTGPPGTGKTYFLRGLMNTVESVRWVFVPPGMVGDLANPAMMEALAEFHGEDTDEDETPTSDRPIVLVVEDADSLLVERKLANMPELSTLLNMTDGLVGTALDLRVIATCNGEIKGMDPAIIRNGRLQAQVKFGLLALSQAERVLRKLGKEEMAVALGVMTAGANSYLGSVRVERAGISLADLYAVVRGAKGAK